MRTSIPAGAPCRLSVRNTSRPLLLRLLFLICLTAVLLTAGACKRKAEPLSETRFQLNTFVTITLYDNPDKAILEGAFSLDVPAVIDCPVDYAENAKLTLHLKELMEGK